jgi:DNA-binding NarL/FixJ family response regulator
MKKTSILLVDDHVILRQGIGRLLNAEPDMEMKFHCSAVGEALLIVATGAVDVVVLDIDLGAERGTDFLAQARRNGFRGPVLVLTAGISEDEEELLRSYGVSTILRKNASVEQLAARIRETIGSPPPAREGPGRPNEPQRQLTARESTVLRLIVEGLINKEIASELDISEAAVKSAIQQLFRKTGAHTRSHLVRLALESFHDQL